MSLNDRAFVYGLFTSLCVALWLDNNNMYIVYATLSFCMMCACWWKDARVKND